MEMSIDKLRLGDARIMPTDAETDAYRIFQVHDFTDTDLAVQSLTSN
jgi:hypothetical protein